MTPRHVHMMWRRHGNKTINDPEGKIKVNLLSTSRGHSAPVPPNQFPLIL